MKPTFYNDEGDEITLPTHMEVCDRCGGRGTHTNPAIDGNGITRDEMDELGEDFLEDYLSGAYDVRCEECKGRNVVEVVDEAALNPEQVRAYESWLEYKHELAHERRMAERGIQW